MAAGREMVAGGWQARPLALLVAGALFMEFLDGNVIAPAAPAMARSFGVPASAIAGVITTYLLTVAVFIPVSGWVADRFGTRATFCTAITVFSLSSAACGASRSLTALTLMRVAQGVGGSMMVPVGRLAVLRETGKQDIIRAIAYLTWPALVAPVIAPALGGAFTSYLSWRWIFFVNVPLGAAGFLLALRLVPESRAPSPTRLDWRGFVLSLAGLGLLVEAASLMSGRSVDVVLVGALASAAGVLAVLAVRHLRNTPAPLVDLAPFRVRTFRLSHASGTAFRLGVSAIPFLLPLMFEENFHWPPVRGRPSPTRPARTVRAPTPSPWPGWPP